MAVVRYACSIPNDTRPTTLGPETEVVPASIYKMCDEGQGGLITMDLDPDDIAPISTFPVGTDVFVLSADEGDNLDLDGIEPEMTRIWWRATIEEPQKTAWDHLAEEPAL
jgi:hypothetical protein